MIANLCRLLADHFPWPNLIAHNAYSRFWREVYIRLEIQAYKKRGGVRQWPTL